MKPHKMWGFIWDPNYLTFRLYIGIKNWFETKIFCKFWRKKSLKKWPSMQRFNKGFGKQTTLWSILWNLPNNPRVNCKNWILSSILCRAITHHLKTFHLRSDKNNIIFPGKSTVENLETFMINEGLWIINKKVNISNVSCLILSFWYSLEYKKCYKRAVTAQYRSPQVFCN